MAGYVPPTPYAGFQGGLLNLQFVDEVLSNVAKQFRPDGYIYDQIVSPQPVRFRSGRYPVFDPAGFFASGGNLKVADDAATPMIDFKWSHDVYLAEDYRLQTKITRAEELQANPVLKLDYSKTIGLLGVFATNRELRLANKLRAQANGGQFTIPPFTPSVKWDQGTATTPATIQADIQQAIVAQKKLCGKRVNTIVLDYEVALAIGNDYTLKDQIKYQIGPRIIAEGMAAVLPPTLFGLNVIVADDPMYNVGRPGDAQATLAGVWGNSVRLIYVPTVAAWGLPATAYSFRAPVVDGAGGTQPPATMLPTGQGGQEPGPAGDWTIVDRWWEMDPPCEHIRAWECVDERVVAPELGVEIQNVLAAY